MGQFSWLDCVDKTQILDDVRADVYVLVPKEFVRRYGVRIKETFYDGYGRFGGHDMYDLVALWNRKYLSPSHLETTKYGKPQRSQYKEETWYQRALERYQWTTDRLGDFIKGFTDKEMKERYDRDYLREIGIDIACYNEDNEKLHYPIKITHNPNVRYEDCTPSLTDPCQGWLSSDDDEEEWDDYSDGSNENEESDEE